MTDHAPSNSANGAMLSPTPTAIETYSGAFVDLLNPDPLTLRLDDVAQHTSQICRYHGATSRFYSIAEHAVLVHDLMRRQGADRNALRGALFHDAAEAYLQDVAAPLKYAMRAVAVDDDSPYDELTRRMEHAISVAFNVTVDSMNSDALRTADMWARRIEAASLTHTGGAHWRWPGALPNDGERPNGVVWLGGVASSSARTMWYRRISGLAYAA